MKKKLGNKKLTNEQIASEALSMFNWAADNTRAGKLIVALDEKKESYKAVTTPIMSKVPKK